MICLKFVAYDLLFLSLQLTGDSQLSLVEAPALVPQEVTISQDQINTMQNDLVQAQNAPIDDQDEEI